ncbi:hypothetical protein BDR22DRAFT_892275 [Usnea florida]
MLISLFVLLICGLVGGGLTSPQRRQIFAPISSTADMPLRGSDNVESVVAFPICEDKQNSCAAFDHPDICCSPGTAYGCSSQIVSQVFCVPFAFSCPKNTVEVPRHTVECPASVDDGAWSTALRSTSTVCLEFHNNALVETQPIGSNRLTVPQRLCDCIIQSATGVVQMSISADNLITDRVFLRCAMKNDPHGERENISQKSRRFSISDSVPEGPTAWRANMGKFAEKNQAEENWESMNRYRRLRRPRAVATGLLVITVVMLAF